MVLYVMRSYRMSGLSLHLRKSVPKRIVGEESDIVKSRFRRKQTRIIQIAKEMIIARLHENDNAKIAIKAIKNCDQLNLFKKVRNTYIKILRMSNKYEKSERDLITFRKYL